MRHGLVQPTSFKMGADFNLEEGLMVQIVQNCQISGFFQSTKESQSVDHHRIREAFSKSRVTAHSIASHVSASSLAFIKVAPIDSKSSMIASSCAKA